MSKKKTVLVFATQHMLTGGIESHLKSFCENMANHGVIVDLLVLNSQMDATTEQHYKKYCRNVFLLKKGGLSGKLGLLGFFLKSLGVKYNALYTNGQGNSIATIIKLCSYRQWVHHHHTAGDKEDQATWPVKYIEVLKKAPVVVACSTKNAGDMELALNREIITTPVFSTKITLDKNNDKNSGKVNLGYYGRLIPEKGIDVLCRLSNEKDLDAIQFHIWGEGEKYNSDFFKQYPNILYHGKFQTKEELKKVLETIDGYLLISVHPEGLPVSLLELMSAGIPWLSTDKGGISDIACDPMATRVIPATESYEYIKEHVNNFASDIFSGKIDRDNQIRLYDIKFASPVLVKQWSSLLFN